MGLCGQLCWAWNASDPAYRVAARLSLLSVVLGVGGLVLASYYSGVPGGDGIHRTHTVHQRFQREPDSELNFTVTSVNYEPVALTEEGGLPHDNQHTEPSFRAQCITVSGAIR